MYLNILEKIRRQNILHGVMLELTYQCNLDCFFCYNEKNPLGKPLQPEQYAKLFHDLARMQVLFLTFSGGEPLVHPHFFEIAGNARQAGFAIRIKSNGILIHGKTARRLKKEVNPLGVELSLHGATAEIHDRQTRLPGSFAKLISNVKEMKQLELRPSLVSTLTSWNEGQVEEMFALADSLGVRLLFQGPVGPRGGANGKSDWQTVTIQPSVEGWKRLEKIHEKRKKDHEDDCLLNECRGDELNETDANAPWCGAGSQEILIDPFGNVFPCLHLRRSEGNLHEQSIAEIWRQGEAFIWARDLAQETTRKMKGKDVRQLGAPLFCPGLDLQGCDANKSTG